MKFLLVDDREDNLLSLEGLLRRDGLELMKARSGDEALELLLVHDVALALLDVNMPGIDGFELAELMRGRERSRNVPIIFVTAGSQQTRIFEGYEAGAVDFLVKPIDPRLLRNKANTFFELHRQRLELEETLRVAETLMAAVGHDLRNPLNAMLMAADVITKKVQDPSVKALTAPLKSSGLRMDRIINDLFDMAATRLGSGIEILRTSTDLTRIAQRVRFELDATGDRVALTTDGNLEGYWDQDRIARVLSNLVSNALTHGKGTRVLLELRGKDDVVISVHNEGAIPPDLLPNVFDPFRSRRERTRRGLGLGLYIVHQIVTAHGGTVEVESTEADGTTFRVTLPRAEP